MIETIKHKKLIFGYIIKYKKKKGVTVFHVRSSLGYSIGGRGEPENFRFCSC
jgi:hypothetical protein